MWGGGTDSEAKNKKSEVLPYFQHYDLQEQSTFSDLTHNLWLKENPDFNPETENEIAEYRNLKNKYTNDRISIIQYVYLNGNSYQRNWAADMLFKESVAFIKFKLKLTNLRNRSDYPDIIQDIWAYCISQFHQYDPDHPQANFLNWLGLCVYHAGIRSANREKFKTTDHYSEMLRIYEKVINLFYSEGVEDPTTVQIAIRMGSQYSPKDVEGIQQMYNTAMNSVRWDENLNIVSYESPVEAVMKSEEIDKLHDALDLLTPEERLIIMLVHGIGDVDITSKKDNTANMTEVARRAKMNIAKANRVYSRAWRKLQRNESLNGLYEDKPDNAEGIGKTEIIKAAMDGWDSTDEILGFKKDDEEDIFKRFGEDDEDDKKVDKEDIFMGFDKDDDDETHDDDNEEDLF